jgi:hypothetical protein
MRTKLRVFGKDQAIGLGGCERREHRDEFIK